MSETCNSSPNSSKHGTLQPVDINPIPKRKSKLVRICKHHWFLVFLCVLSICDALLVVTELTVDILATKIEKQELCDTRGILEYLQSQYHSELDGFLTNHSIDDLLDEIQQHTDAILHIDHGGNQVADQHLSTDHMYDVITTTRVTRPPARPTTTDSEIHTTTPNYTRDDHTSAPATGHSKIFYSPMLHEIASVCRYGSIAILSVTMLLNIIKVYALKMKFFHSKLQVIDAVVVVISLVMDVCFLPMVWTFTDATMTALPIILGLSWRVLRIVNNALINLSEKDKIRLVRMKAQYKHAVKKSRQRKIEAFNLKGLCRKYGAEESDIVACSNLAKAMKRRRSSTIATGIMAISNLVLFGNVDSDQLPHSDKFVNDSDDDGGADLAAEMPETGYMPRFKKSLTDDRSLLKFRRGLGRRKMSTSSNMSAFSMDSNYNGEQMDDDNDLQDEDDIEDVEISDDDSVFDLDTTSDTGAQLQAPVDPSKHKFSNHAVVQLVPQLSDSSSNDAESMDFMAYDNEAYSTYL